MVEFRLAARGDAREMATMSRDLVEYGLVWSWTEARVRRSILDPDTTALLASVDGRTAGFAIMQFGDDDAHLNLLAVRPYYQRHGVGRGLIAWLERSARVAGVTTVYLEVRTRNIAGRAFYRRLGFREIAYLPGYYAERESGLRMLRDLSWHSTTISPER